MIYVNVWFFVSERRLWYSFYFLDLECFLLFVFIRFLGLWGLVEIFWVFCFLGWVVIFKDWGSIDWYLFSWFWSWVIILFWLWIFFWSFWIFLFLFWIKVCSFCRLFIFILLLFFLWFMCGEGLIILWGSLLFFNIWGERFFLCKFLFLFVFIFIRIEFVYSRKDIN